VKLHALRLPFPFKVMDRGGWCGSPARRRMEVADRGVLLGLTDDHMAHRGGGAAARDLRVRSGVRDQGIRDGARVGQSEGKKKEKMGRAQRNNVIS
jgi:hypothetical protein